MVEGRDIGSVVAPDADVKVFLTADAAARAHRRALEEGGVDIEATRESLLARDEIDTGRTASPLVMADGAVHVDGTAYSLEDVVDLVVSLVEAAAGLNREANPMTEFESRERVPGRHGGQWTDPRRRGSSQRRQVHPGQPDHRPARGRRGGRAGRDP